MEKISTPLTTDSNNLKTAENQYSSELFDIEALENKNKLLHEEIIELNKQINIQYEQFNELSKAMDKLVEENEQLNDRIEILKSINSH